MNDGHVSRAVTLRVMGGRIGEMLLPSNQPYLGPDVEQQKQRKKKKGIYCCPRLGSRQTLRLGSLELKVLRRRVTLSLMSRVLSTAEHSWANAWQFTMTNEARRATQRAGFSRYARRSATGSARCEV